MSCKKEQHTFDLWNCSNLLMEDSAKLAQQLPGRWSLVSKRCPMMGRNFQNMEGIRLTLQGNGQYILEEYDRMADQGQWTLSPIDQVNWTLTLNLPNQYMHGKVAVCGNQLMFFDSFRDGCDHVFVKQ
jgi:hypothetical protein